MLARNCALFNPEWSLYVSRSDRWNDRANRLEMSTPPRSSWVIERCRRVKFFAEMIAQQLA